MPQAKAIYQANLDAVSAALWNRDLPRMLMHIALPNYMGTDDADLVVCSPDEMLIVMTDFRDHLESLGADTYERTCKAAAFVQGRKDIIVGQHETRILKDGVPLRPPYVNGMSLIFSQGRWLAFRIEAQAMNDEEVILSKDMAEAQRKELSRLNVLHERKSR